MLLLFLEQFLPLPVLYFLDSLHDHANLARAEPLSYLFLFVDLVLFIARWGGDVPERCCECCRYKPQKGYPQRTGGSTFLVMGKTQYCEIVAQLSFFSLCEWVDLFEPVSRPLLAKIDSLESLFV